MSTRVIAVIASMASVHANVPIVVSGGVGRRVAMSLSNKATHQLENGDVSGAKRNVDAALHADPKFWPALYQHAEILQCRAKNLRSRIAMKHCGYIRRLSTRLFCVLPSTRSLENTQEP
jgi:Tfp pilus assembly protein PilF